MTKTRGSKFKLLAMSGCAALAIATAAQAAEPSSFDVPGGDLKTALVQFANQSNQEILFSSDIVAGRRTSGVTAQADAPTALAQLLRGTGLTFQQTDTGTLLVVRADQDPQGGSAAGGGATVEALIVTAQKREEDIQDVPIAISAFSQEDLTRSQIAGGPDLITQVPNMTFTKTNFSSYSVQLRGIGTQAISATTDPAVAVAFNNTPFIRNRFFEQEFYDLQRVEVLRGPQGTLYGRNATAGVVNIISAKPKFFFEAKASADISNYSSSRIEGMVNIPIVEDAVALRLAGAWTKRDGYAYNQITGSPIDGRDLWSTRVSLRVSPNDRIDANLIWEHFEENDDRLRSGKQLCKRDIVTNVAGFDVGYYDTLPNLGFQNLFSGVQATFSQGCALTSLYSPDAFQTPNGIMLPYYIPLGAIGLPLPRIESENFARDPYVSTTQSRDLREIESTIDPDYRADSDLGEFQISIDITDSLTLSSETAYSVDTVYSMQDFNRFNTAPGAWADADEPVVVAYNLIGRNILQDGPNGTIWCDPQLGCADRLVAADISTAKARQFSQEFRLASDFDGPFNFSLGANYLRADSEDKYYVFINSISLIAARDGLQVNSIVPQDNISNYAPGVTDNSECLLDGMAPGNPNVAYSVTGCVYMDPNPIGSLNDKGHNYFLSKNPYKLISYAAFGEAYYNISDNLKVTAGLRWTVDKKDAPRIPTWILASQTVGYPVAEVIEQEWREPTGRLALDWKPDLSFTDETLLYASYAHGYKAGGANPPGFVRAFYGNPTVADTSANNSLTKPKVFDPEFVDAFELGSKNTLADGRMTLNLAAFYYDYKDYQISEIVDRSAFNRNFDATVWGVELEADWRPLENLRFGLKGGYEKTRIADGERAIDLMDRTAGDPDWTLVRPFPTFASSCILPTWLFVGNRTNTPENPELVGLGNVGGGGPGGCERAYLQGFDPVTSADYVAHPPSADAVHLGVINYTAYSTDPNDFPGWPDETVTDRTYPGWDPATAPNGGEGIAKQLGGNELPNAPNWTWTITGDYTLPLAGDWLATLHTDLHWQSESYWRIFNDQEFDKLDEYFTMNLAAIFTNEEAGWNIMAYVKNVTDETAITGAFLNSDDTALTTNVFLTEPRLYGLRVTKNWSGGPLLGTFGENRSGPRKLTLELGGQVQRHDAPQEMLHPSFGSAFVAPLDIFDSAQNDDLDWGDGREVKLIWRPAASSWRVSAGIRYGETNGNSNPSANFTTDPVCAAPPEFAQFCPTLSRQLQAVIETNWAEAEIDSREEHRIADFVVGRDLGLGSFDASVGLGLRYARLNSETHTSLDGVPDWYMADGFYPFGISTHTQYNATIDAQRQFEGVGPVVTFDASRALLGDVDSGHLDIDLSVEAGVLFGDRESRVSGGERKDDYSIRTLLVALGYNANGPTQSTPTPFDISPRSDSTAVPTLGLGLGLSYTIGGASVGAGYRWERYFDAIDGGIDEPKDYDRTIDGPYFKLSVGFGG